MVKKLNISKRSKRRYYIIIGILLFLFAIPVAYSYFTEEWVLDQLKTVVLNASHNRYELKADDLDISLYRRRLYFKNPRIEPVKNIEGHAALYYFRADKAVMNDVSVVDLFLNKELRLGYIEFAKPVIRIYQDESDSIGNETAIPFEDKNGKLKSIYIGTINIVDADMKLYRSYTDSLPALSVQRNDIYIKAFQMNNEIADAGRLFKADTLELNILNVEWEIRGEMYRLRAAKISASYNDSLMTVDSLMLVPLLSRHEFSRKVGYQTDRFAVSIPHLRLHKMAVKKFFERNVLVAQQLEIQNMTIEAYRDKNYARKQMVVPSFQQMVTEFPLKLSIDTVKIKNSHVLYEELAVKASHSGKITIGSINSSITGLSNMESDYSKRMLRIGVEARLMDRGDLTADFIFPMHSKKVNFDCSGKLQSMKLDALNGITKNNANIEIKSGVIDSMMFSFHADHLYARGKLRLIYHDLSVEILNIGEKDNVALDKVVTLAANAFVVRKNNPEKGEEKYGTIMYANNPQRFLFNYSHHALLSGITDIIKKDNKLSFKKKKND